jgi:hypothetical protein
MVQEYPRESIEYVFFDELMVDGQAPPGAVEYSLSRPLGRPVLWAPLVVQGGKFCFLLTGLLDPGPWKVWVRVPDAPEASVIEAGQIVIT